MNEEVKKEVKRFIRQTFLKVSTWFNYAYDIDDQPLVKFIKIGFRSDARRGSNWADSVTGASNGLTTTSFLRRNSGSANQINDEEADGIRNSTSSRKPSLVSRLRWVFNMISSSPSTIASN